MKTKSFTLLSGSFEDWHYDLVTTIGEDSSFREKGSAFHLKNLKLDLIKNRYKINIRKTDKSWVYRNIPSSIVWHTEIHHNWANNGTMYLLTKGEHILKHRREIGEKE